jgi:hypothetical protein
MADAPDPPRPRPAKAPASREENLAAALRAILRRRKAPVAPPRSED